MDVEEIQKSCFQLISLYFNLVSLFIAIYACFRLHFLVPRNSFFFQGFNLLFTLHGSFFLNLIQLKS